MRQLKNMIRYSAVLLYVMLAIAVIPVTAAAIDDADALKGVASGKAVFDVNLGDAGKLALYLSIIEDTHEGLVKQGVKPDLILAFHGPSVLLISKNRSNVPVEQRDKYDEVAELIKELKGLGVKLEVCSIATRLMKVDNATIYPEIKVIGNSFISLIGYQTKGYAYIPIY
jgi:intracellular sulfur oxidation DsrE/DsrF family protein